MTEPGAVRYNAKSKCFERWSKGAWHPIAAPAEPGGGVGGVARASIRASAAMGRVAAKKTAAKKAAAKKPAKKAAAKKSPARKAGS